MINLEPSCSDYGLHRIADTPCGKVIRFVDINWMPIAKNQPATTDGSTELDQNTDDSSRLTSRGEQRGAITPLGSLIVKKMNGFSYEALRLPPGGSQGHDRVKVRP